MPYSVELRSDLSSEVFEYDTPEEQFEAARRLALSAQTHYKQDGIDRQIIIRVGDEAEGEE